MLPRTRAESSPEAEATIASLRRKYQKQPKRHSSWGLIIAGLAIGWVGAILFMSRNATPTVMRAELVTHFAPRPIGDAERVQLPDGRILWTKVSAGVRSLTDLPLIGNQIGDMRYVSGTGAFWVWTTPINGGLATWIDP